MEYSYFNTICDLTQVSFLVVCSSFFTVVPQSMSFLLGSMYILVLSWYFLLYFKLKDRQLIKYILHEAIYLISSE